MITKIVKFLNSLPNLCGVDRTKQSDPTSIHFWYRQVFHFAGGLVVTLLLGLIFAPLAAFGWVGLMGFIMVKESDDSDHGQPLIKTIVDSCVWFLGAVLGMVITFT